MVAWIQNDRTIGHSLTTSTITNIKSILIVDDIKNHEGITLLFYPNLSTMPPFISYKDQIMKFKQIYIKSIVLMIYKIDHQQIISP
jgi:hypothetical protein